MTTVNFWRTIGQGHYDPDIPATIALIYTKTYRFLWMARVAQWFWNDSRDYISDWSTEK